MTSNIGLALSPQTVSSEKPMTTIYMTTLYMPFFRLSGQLHKQTLINQQNGKDFQTDIEIATNKIEPDSMYVCTAKVPQTVCLRQFEFFHWINLSANVTSSGGWH